MSEPDENIDNVIEEIEDRLNHLYSSKKEKTPEIATVNIENVEKSNENNRSMTKDLDLQQQLNNVNIFNLLYIVLPVVSAAVFYYFKPKIILKGTKFDRFKYLRAVFISTVVIWLALFAVKYGGYGGESKSDSKN